MKVFLSAHYGRREELKGYVRLLEDHGHESTATWLSAEHDTADDASTDPADWARWAERDADDISGSEVFVAFKEQPGNHSRGGRHAELGIALAWKWDGEFSKMDSVYLIGAGEPENVFQYADGIERHDTFDDLLGVLDTIVADKIAERKECARLRAEHKAAEKAMFDAAWRCAHCGVDNTGGMYCLLCDWARADD